MDAGAAPMAGAHSAAAPAGSAGGPRQRLARSVRSAIARYPGRLAGALVGQGQPAGAFCGAGPGGDSQWAAAVATATAVGRAGSDSLDGADGITHSDRLRRTTTGAGRASAGNVR